LNKNKRHPHPQILKISIETETKAEKLKSYLQHPRSKAAEAGE